MLKKIILSMVVTLSCSASFASLDGLWSGWGDWTFQGAGDHCNPMSMRFTESDKELHRIGGAFECTMVRMDVAELVLAKSGKDLLVNGEVIGSVNGNTYQWVEYVDSVKIEDTIVVDGRHFDLTETWIGSGGEVIYVIKGRFFLKD